LQLHALLDQGITVVTASRRLAHAVRLGHARHAQQSGASAWETPRVLPWSTWLRQQRLEVRAQSADLWPRSRVLSPAQARVLWDDIVATSKSASDLLNPSSAARLAARSWRRLHDHLIPIEELQTSEAPEAGALYGWCREFLRRCDALDAIDEARLAQWAHDTQFVPQERLACAGFDAMTPAMGRLLDRWRARGLVIDIDLSPRTAREISLVGAADATAELGLAARWARERLRDGAENVGVILHDLQSRRELVRRVFEDAFAPGSRQTLSSAAPLPVVIAAPAPMSSYPLVDAALLVLELAASDCTSTHVGRLLRSPFIAGGDAERARRALADLRLREEQRDRWDWFELERWADVTGCEQLRTAGRAITTALRECPRTAPASEWVEKFQEILLAAGWPGERAPDSAEYQTLEKFQNVLAELGTLDAVTGRMSMSRALSGLRDLLSDTPFEAETPDARVTVIDAATSAGMQFDALWVAGLDADHLPVPVNPDPLIPLELQRAHGIPEASAAGVLQQATRQLQRWVSSAEAIVLSWPQRDGDVHLGPSPLLQEVGGVHVAMTPASATSLRDTLFAQRPALEVFLDDRAPMLPAQKARGGARTLELQSRCPFRAQAEIRLRAQPLPRVSLGVEPVDRGALLHRVLEDVWGALRTQHTLLQVGVADLETKVREAARRHAAQALQTDTRHRSRIATLEIESVTSQVMQLLELEKQRPPFAVRFAEAAGEYEIGGLRVTLRPDRIDELAGGGELLIDYKLGKSHRQRDWFDVLSGRPRRPQLPLYGLARGERLRALAYVVIAPGTIEFRGWSDGTPVAAGIVAYPNGMRIDFGDPADWQSLMQQWRFTMTRLAQHYVAGDAQVDPLPLECATCHLSTLCRVHERIVDEGGSEMPGDD
jgi:ATP-dependent helicase/nuclease subunit B